MDRFDSGSWDFLTGDPRIDHENVRLIMDTVHSLYAETEAHDQMLEAVRRAVAVTGADQGFLLVPRDAAGGELAVSEMVDRRPEDTHPGGRYSRKVVRSVWHTGMPVLWNSIPPDMDPKNTLPSIGMQSGMAVRLEYRNRPVGVLYVHAAQRRRKYGDTELKVFRALAALIGAALETRRLNEEEHLRREMQEQIERAREVQERFTPRDVDLPPGLDVATHADVSLHLSGDYCDVLARPDGAVALVIGDVSGKGIRTALYSSETRALVRRHMRDGDAPDVTLTSVNAFLVEDMAHSDFMTLFVGVLDAERLTLCYASAGHNPPLLRRADGTISELERTGPALGWFDDAVFGCSDPVRLAAGDVVLLYTDGMVEGHDAAGRMYGEDRLRDALDRHAARTRDAESLRRRLIADLDAFLDGARREDDVTCIVLRVGGDAG